MREGEGDDAARIRRGAARVGTGMSPSLTPPGEAVHQAFLGPLGGRGFGLGKAVRTRHSNGAKAKLPGPALQGIGEGHLCSRLGADSVSSIGAMQGTAVWKELQLLLSLNLPDTAYYLWEGTATCYHCDEQRLVIGAPTEQSARQLVQAYPPVVRRTLEAIPDPPKRASVLVTTRPRAHARL